MDRSILLDKYLKKLNLEGDLKEVRSIRMQIQKELALKVEIVAMLWHAEVTYMKACKVDVYTNGKYEVIFVESVARGSRPSVSNNVLKASK